jgi:hypothetical protein
MPHRGQGGPGSVDRAHQVHLQQPAELLLGGILEERPADNAGVVYPRVDPTPTLQGGSGNPLYLLPIRNIARDHQRLSAAVFDLPSRRLEQLDPPGGKDEPGPLIAQEERHRLPDTARGPRHHHDPTPDALLAQDVAPFRAGWPKSRLGRPPPRSDARCVSNLSGKPLLRDVCCHRRTPLSVFVLRPGARSRVAQHF